MRVGEIIGQVDTPHAVITGGEPTMYDLDSLFVALKMTDKYIQLETSGQYDLKGAHAPNWITVSPKANLEFKIAPGLRRCASEIKWVVDKEITFDPVLELWDWYEENAAHPPWFYFMPEGCPPEAEMMKKVLSWILFAPIKMQRKFRMSDRLQYRAGVR